MQSMVREAGRNWHAARKRTSASSDAGSHLCAPGGGSTVQDSPASRRLAGEPLHLVAGVTVVIIARALFSSLYLVS